MTRWGFAGRVVAAYAMGFVMFLGLRHWQAGLPWSQAALDATVFAFIPTVGGLAFRRAFHLGEPHHRPPSALRPQRPHHSTTPSKQTDKRP